MQPLLSDTAVAAPPSPASNPLTRLAELTADDMAAVEALIAQRLQSPIGQIPDVALHLIGAGGKRLRPMLTVAAARLVGYPGPHHIGLAATVEFIHSATLLHDDVVDGSGQRRGRRTANLVWGNASSVLVGDFLFARAFAMMVETGSLRVLEILSNASCVIAEGEVRQLAAIGNLDAGVDEYLAIIDAKTAALFAAATRVGAVVAGRPAAEEAQLAAYGRSLGLAFQLVDDALDYGGASAKMGKDAGDDFREGKLTLPVAIAIAAADAGERAFWARTFTGDRQDGDFDTACAILERHGAIEATVDAARAHAQSARASLAGFGASPLADALRDLTDFVVERAA